MAYGLSNGHVTDDVTWPPNVLWGSTVGYPSDSLASSVVSYIMKIMFYVRRYPNEMTMMNCDADAVLTSYDAKYIWLTCTTKTYLFIYFLAYFTLLLQFALCPMRHLAEAYEVYTVACCHFILSVHLFVYFILFYFILFYTLLHKYRVGQIKWHHFTFACNKLMHKRNFMIFDTNKLHKATNGMLPVLC